MQSRNPIYGLLAEFHTPEEVVAAAQKVHAAGYTRVDAYSPFPVEGLAEALGFHRTRIPFIVLCGGLLGACSGFYMQWYANVISYPWNIGGRPPNSWPAWIPITFELGVLFATFAGLIGMLALNGLPMPYHPVFNVPAFQLASRDKFFICIETADPRYNPEDARRLLESLNPAAVTEVPSR